MAHSQSAARFETAAHMAFDSRADQGTRWVKVTPDAIQIDRVLSGMKMHIHVPTEAYLGISLNMRDLGQCLIYEIGLAHRDPELSVTLESTDDRLFAMRLCQQWSVYLNQPVLGALGLSLSLASESPLTAAEPRRRCMTAVAKRRPRRLARRKGGNLGNLGMVRRGEREIICYE
jgi:hypothetical protein